MGAINQAQQLANKPFTPYTGQMVAGAGQINPYAQNPYADQLVGQVTGDITSNYQNAIAPNLMAQFNQGGAYGGSAHLQALQGSQDALGRQLAQASTGIRGQQADILRDEYSKAQGREQQLYDANYNEFLRQQGYGQQALNPLLQALSTIQGGTVSGTAANPNYRSAGQNAATAAAIFASLYGGGS